MKAQATVLKGTTTQVRQQLKDMDARTFEYLKRSQLSEAAALEAAKHGKGVRFNGTYFEG